MGHDPRKSQSLETTRAAQLADDETSAAHLVAALLATGAVPDQADALLAALASTPRGRQALAGLLDQPGYWRRSLLPRLYGAGRPADVLATLAVAAQAGIATDCRQLNRYLATQGSGFTDANGAAIAAAGC